MSTIRIARASTALLALTLVLVGAAPAHSNPRGGQPVAFAPAAANDIPAPSGGAVGSFDVITAEQIAATSAVDIKTALALLPELVVNDTGGFGGVATLSLRGSSARQVLVLVDGHRVGAVSASFNLNDIAVPLERIARIEVLPAPISLIYGPDALAGVVNIVTRPPAAAPAFALSYGRGTQADQRVAGGIQYGVSKLGLRVDGQWLSGGGDRENADADQKSFAVGMALAPAPWGFDVRWTSLSREAGLPGPSAYPTPQARRTDSQDGLHADIVYRSGKSWDLTAGAFTRNQVQRLSDPAPPVIDPAVPAEPIADRRENSSYGAGMKMTIDTGAADLFTVGGEWVNDRFKSDDDPDRQADRWSLYTQDLWRSGGWTAAASLRRDQHAVYGGRTNPSLSVGWGSGGWRLWGAWAKNYRVPSYDELYRDEQFSRGNPELKLETGNSYDGGVEISGAQGRARLSVLRRDVNELIVWGDADGDFVYRPENLGHARVTGWEAQVLYRPSATIAIPLGYQQLSTQDDASGESVPGAVHRLWRAAIQGAGAALGWSLEYAFTDRGAYARRAGSWTTSVLNAAVSWRDTIGGVPVRASLRAENLLDQAGESVEGYPLRGRSWFAEVKLGI